MIVYVSNVTYDILIKREMSRFLIKQMNIIMNIIISIRNVIHVNTYSIFLFKSNQHNGYISLNKTNINANKKSAIISIYNFRFVHILCVQFEYIQVLHRVVKRPLQYLLFDSFL